MPSYDFTAFKKACMNKTDVFIVSQALKDANNIFNLRTKNDLLEFIGNDGLEDLHFINTKEWEKNPDRSLKIQVDAYEFKTMNILGYIAFLYSPHTKKWIIKSFKQSENRSDIMKIALEEAFLKLKQKERGKDEEK